MSTNERPARQAVKTRCWHGSKSELKRLIDAFCDLQLRAKGTVEADIAHRRSESKKRYESLVETAMESFEAPISRTNEAWLRDLLIERSTPWDVSASLRRERARPLMTTLYAAEFNSKDQGPPGEVFGRLNPDQATSITLEYGGLYDEDDVAAMVTLSRDKCEAEFSGGETYVAAAVAKFENLFRQQRPRYAWLRSSWFLLPFVFITALVATTLFAVMLPPLHENLASAVFMPVFLALFGGQYALVLWLIPAFQLYEDHKKSRSQLAVGVLAAIVVSLIASLVLLPFT